MPASPHPREQGERLGRGFLGEQAAELSVDPVGRDRRRDRRRQAARPVCGSSRMPSRAAYRAARSARVGSSSNELGCSTRRTPSARSSLPPWGSSSSASPRNGSAMALIGEVAAGEVFARSEPALTSGSAPGPEYVSRRADAISTRIPAISTDAVPNRSCSFELGLRARPPPPRSRPRRPGRGPRACRPEAGPERPLRRATRPGRRGPPRSSSTPSSALKARPSDSGSAGINSAATYVLTTISTVPWPPYAGSGALGAPVAVPSRSA